jgi:Tfp pilus assembly protein PilV
MKKINIEAAGYSLIETIVAMLILSASLAGAVQVMSTSLFRIQENQHKIVAVYLAQECMELTRNVRDSAWRQNMPWHCPFLDNGEIVPAAPAKYLTIENGMLDTQNVSAAALADYSFCRANMGVTVTADQMQNGLVFENRGIEYAQQLIVDEFDISQEMRSVQGVQTQVQILNSLRASCVISWPERSGVQKVEMNQVLSNWKQ